MQEEEYIYKLRDLNYILREIKDLRSQYEKKKETFESMVQDFKEIAANKNKPLSHLYIVKDYFHTD